MTTVAPQETPSAVSRAQIVAEARAWINTPYHHQASAKGAGADCLGLIRGVYRAVCGAEPEKPPPYTPDWAEQSGKETLCDAAQRHLDEIAIADVREGDVILFRLRERGPAKHAAIVTDADHMVHAYDRHAVLETSIPQAWRRRIAYAFKFRNLID